MAEKLLIVLPKTLPILCARPRQSITVDAEEYTIYFRNFIFPYRESYDVQVECAYGGNFGEYWRISAFPEDVRSFPLTVRVYDEWGKKLGEKTTAVELRAKGFSQPEFRLICIGDSMTHGHIYVDHIAMKLNHIQLIGTRSFNGTVAHEGRGGWRAEHFTDCYMDWWGGASPFVFPKGVSGKDYFGDKRFEARLHTPELDSYSLDGYQASCIQPGQIYHDEGKLFVSKPDGDAVINDAPEWQFSFSKYMEHNGIGRVDAVSILLGANDLQNCPYEKSEECVAKYIRGLTTIVDSIHAYDPALDVIVNMPVVGAEQFAWGLRGADSGSAKMYKYNIIMANKAILDRWDGCEKAHVWISPMLLALDPVYGFDRQYYPANCYSDQRVCRQSNWVHPNRAGYCQMGDALAGVVEKLRSN